MGAGCKGSCGSTKGPQPTTVRSSKRASYQAPLDAWWPSGAPFPPAAPWVRTHGSRGQVVAGLERVGEELPDLPSPGDPMAPENLSMVSEIILGLEGSPGGMVAYSGCSDKEDDTPKPVPTSTCNAEGCECYYRKGDDGKEYIIRSTVLEDKYTIEERAELACVASDVDWNNTTMCYDEFDNVCNLRVACTDGHLDGTESLDEAKAWADACS